ncbi:prepilin-type N-terminal cleavage/methylation domain-containing protein [Breoghania corrubedonensis]|uniref:Type II secretion system protein J n=1 Tax=Breoghania corrubedonensis TaxID=665038 RepID=A0A2T5VBC5_9HYPH|nr:type II secretion system protein GspJ [Breoghania corrubedonensis]PTW61052.1 prepilin-type N-terminal cleavage/methylation domain-containing protein [Breoghania corrubedonensis]
MNARSQSRAGFAMMEMLIAMALLGVIASFIAGSLAFGNRVWERTNRISDNGRRLSEIGFLRDSLSQALVFPKTGNNETTFQGQANSISIVMLRPAEGLAAEQPWHISFSRIAGTDHLTVGFSPPFTGRVQPQERVILDHLKGFSVRYYGRLLDQDRIRWQESWEDQPHLPDLIEISLRFEDDGHQTDRMLLVHPKVH